MEWKVSSFFRSLGLKKSGEPLVMDWSKVEGAKGRGHFKPDTYTGNDGRVHDKNELDYFIDFDPEFFPDPEAMVKELKEMGIEPTFLLGSRTENELMQIAEFEKVGRVFITTENGAVGEQGYVTQHSVLKNEQFDQVYTCGPKPMMVAVARWAKAAGVACEVSLENKMACGVGACLCCVEDTKEGHVCVCSEGPVFSIDKLSWQI